MSNWWFEFLYAVQFLTRVSVSSIPHSEDSLARATKFFPVVGFLVGMSASTLYLLLDQHLPKLVTASVVLAYLVFLTGCLHEDGLADTADGFGGGWDRDQILAILRDSRIGSYGGAALALSLILRVVLLASLSRAEIFPVVTTAHVLCRWTTLPLSYFLPPARVTILSNANGQGARVASLTSTGTVIGGTIFSFGCAIFLLHWHALSPIGTAILCTVITGFFYKKRIGGITGDCFGATNQVTEIAAYFTGVWRV